MRTWEWILAAWAMAGALGLARQRPPLWGWSFCAVAALLLALQTGREGAHWQLIPLYLGLVVVGISAVRAGSGMVTAIAGFCLIGCTLAFSWALPMFRLPKPTGPYAVGVRTLHLTDGARSRELVTQIWYPAEAVGARARYARRRELKGLHSYLAELRTNAYQDAPLPRGASIFPLVILGPRWGGTRTQNTSLAEELASHGYIVAAVDHPGNAARVEMSDGRVVAGTMSGSIEPQRGVAQVVASWEAELAVWLADDLFVLNALTAAQGELSWLKGRLDMDRVAAVGHSFGGAASMGLLGEDPRVRCGVNLDGWTLGGLATRTHQPVLFVYAAPPGPLIPQPEALASDATADDTLNRMDEEIVDKSLQQFGGLEVFIPGTLHADFTDATLVSPIHRLTSTSSRPGDRMQRITRGLVLGFLDRTLRGTGTLPDYPELRWRFRGAGTASVEVPQEPHRP